MTVEHLDNLALIKITGEDAANFLQGQLTNDIEQLSSNWQFNGYCNPKGRLMALLMLWRDNNNYYAITANDLMDSVIMRLRMYILRSKVTIEPISNVKLLGIFSTDDLNNVSSLAVDQIIDDRTNQPVLTNGNKHLLKINDRYLLISQQMPTSVSNNDDWNRHNIQEGIPHIGAALNELFIPQMINLDVLNGISFKKGCYTGQEIVARMRYLGKLKQRMFVCDFEQNESIQIADKVLNEAGKNVGTIVSVCDNANPTQSTQSGLAVLRLESIDQALTLDDGSAVTVRESQPYSFE